MAYADGDPFITGTILSYQQANRMKDHWNAAAAPTNPQGGMLHSNSGNDVLKHYGAFAAAWIEVLQAGIPFSGNINLDDDAQIIGGNGSDSILIPYEEMTNDAVIWGLPIDPKRGLIFCDVADIGGDLTVVVTSAFPQVAWIDLDLDSYFALGWEADDKPKIDVGGNAEGIIIPVCADDETKVNNYNVLVTDFGKTFIMNAVDKIFSLPSVDASDIGAILTFIFISTGTLTIDAADADTIDDSGVGDGIYCTQNGEKYSTITLMLASVTEWVILAAKGIWTTTE